MSGPRSFQTAPVAVLTHFIAAPHGGATIDHRTRNCAVFDIAVARRVEGSVPRCCYDSFGIAVDRRYAFKKGPRPDHLDGGANVALVRAW